MLLTRKLYPVSSLRFEQLSAKLIMRSAIIIRVSICYCSLPLVTILCIHAPNQQILELPGIVDRGLDPQDILVIVELDCVGLEPELDPTAFGPESIKNRGAYPNPAPLQ